MKILRFQGSEGPQYGILEDSGTVRALIGSPFRSSSLDLGRVVGPLSETELLPPVEPSKVVGVGLNYRLHIAEGHAAAPEIPMLFMKPPSAVIGPERPIVYPRRASNVHFEGELAVVIGKRARHVDEHAAPDYVLGYTCANDVSDRDVQRREMAMGVLLAGKGYDTFCPLGPVVATNLDPSALDLVTRVNGVIKQRTSTADLLFSVGYLISYMSRFFTLVPGDVILTGTPSGVGAITPGDTIEIEISGIGVLRNPVVAEE